jgi:isopenicillin N synthase-like dioxygenase
MNPRKIPVIDLAPYATGVEKHRVAAEVARACETVGFLVITGHGVSSAVLDGIVDATRRFFALPEATKAGLVSPDPDVFRGYSRLESKSLAKSKSTEWQPDLREAFTVNRVQDKSDPYYRDPAAGKLFSPNIWPDEALVPGFAAAFTAYYLALDELATTLMRVFAVALDLPETFFDDKVDRHFSNLTAYHYPPQSAPPRPGQLRGGAHTDFGSLTLVYASPSARGLQAWSGTEWEDVPTVPGTFVVNIGDLMAQWSNDRWVSTLHRVANPLDAASNQSRYSIAFFHQPNYDVLIKSLDMLNVPKYPPITSGEHLRRKITAMRTQG